MALPVVRTTQATCKETPMPSSCKYNLFNIGFVWNDKSGKKVILIEQNAHRF